MTKHFAVWCLAAIISLISLGQPGAAATYDVEADFNATSNPSGAWSYGGYGTLNDASSFFAFTTAITNAYGGVGLNGWSGGGAYTILQNQTGSPLSPGTPIYPAGGVTMHPSGSGAQVVIRWTALLTGSINVAGLFSAADLIGLTTTTDTQVFLNAASVFAGIVNGMQGQSAAFNLDLGVNAGDTVDFVVGVGQDGNYFYDTTQLEAVITEMPAGVPLPAGLVLLGTGLFGLTALRRRRRLPGLS